MITGDQIRQARKLLGWHRGQIAIRARGITGNTIGKAEGAFPGKPPTPEQLAEIRAVLEAARGPQWLDKRRRRRSSSHASTDSAGEGSRATKLTVASVLLST